MPNDTSQIQTRRGLMKKKSKPKTNQLVYFELHVNDRTFYVHGIVKASGPKEAYYMLNSISGKNYHLQLKGSLGKATIKNMTRALKDSIPNDSLINTV